MLSLTRMGTLEELEAALPGHKACQELRRLFELAEVRVPSKVQVGLGRGQQPCLAAAQ